MGKPARERVLADNEAMAYAKLMRTSPQKLNLVATMIRGKAVSRAVSDLTFSSRRIAGEVKKVLQAAIANAENNHQLDVDRLYVKEATVGKTLRWRTASPTTSRCFSTTATGVSPRRPATRRAMLPRPSIAAASGDRMWKGMSGQGRAFRFAASDHVGPLSTR